jgi:RNA polymerase sigma-70 factor, ECF subfamily
MDVRATPESDALVVARVAGGDEDAFAELYDRYADVVFAVAVRLVGDRQVAEEVVQETYLVLWNRADRFDPSLGSLIGWLVAVARNRATDRLRAAGRRPQVVLFGARPASIADDALDRAIAAGEPVAAAALRQDPEEELGRAFVRQAVRAALAGVPDEERLALELAYYADMSQSEIAERLGWPLGTVKTRTRRALGRLRAALRDVVEPGLPPAPAVSPTMRVTRSRPPSDILRAGSGREELESGEQVDPEDRDGAPDGP